MKADGTEIFRKMNLGSIERLDQSHLYPLREHPGGQTFSLPPPGIEPGSPTSQAGTLPKELSRQLV
jgi:hypothetical protein